MVGRPPKTVEQHLRDGTYRKDRHGDRLYAEATGAIGEPPDELSDEAAQIWRATAAALYKTLGEGDRDILAHYCRWCAMARQLMRDAESESNPLDRIKLVNAAAMATKQYASLATKIGATPMDRQRLKGDPTAGEDDPLDLLRQSGEDD